MALRTTVLAAFLVASSAAHAAATAEAVTPVNSSVETSATQVISARFRDVTGNPSVGEMVTFSNDACGLFPNGLTQITVPTDAGGVASTSFTAGSETGVRCVVRAVAGAAIGFTLITYRLDQVALGTVVLASPNPPLPGRPFTIEAFVRLGSTELPNVDFTVQVIRGTGNGTISSTGGGTGALTRFQLNVFPEGAVGDFEVEFDFRGRKLRFPVRMGAVAGLYQDMWWAGSGENGWGMSVVQHEDRLFVVLYVYRDDGTPTWYVMSGGTWNAARTVYTGPLYSPRGSPFFAYDASRFMPGPEIGTLSITFNDASNAVIDYNFGGTQGGSKSISRQPVGTPRETTMVNRGDMFWGGVSQNGWGVAALQQYEQYFVVWFTYDAAGLPIWFVLPSGTFTNASTLEGRLYRTTSSAWLGSQYRASQLSVIDVGPYRLRFTDGVASSLEYTVESRTGTLSLVPQGF